MTLEFQTEVLQFLVQNKNAKKYLKIIQSDLFSEVNQSIVFDLFKTFWDKYNTQPTLASILEYFEMKVNVTKQDINPEDRRILLDTVREAYDDFTGNADFIRDVLLKEYQMKLMRDMFTENMPALKEKDPEVVFRIQREASKIKQLSEQDDEEENRGRFALEDFQKGQRSITEATPSYLHGLNRLTSTGGFYAPQLIILMGAPKSFKTGTALNLALNFVRAGFKVYYVDCENGEDRILDRFYQGLLESNWHDYNSGKYDDELEEIIGKMKLRGGDFRSDFYPANTKSMMDVEDNLDFLQTEHNWTPEIIIYDYLDLMVPEDRTIKEKRLKIQAVYHDAIRLQKRRTIFGMSPSQVSRDAVNKPVINMTDFAEDFGKAANCHAAFAICRTDDEKQAGVGRIVPVLQRDGVAQHSNAVCFIEINEANMSVKEIKHDEWEERVGAVGLTRDGKKPRQRKKPKNLSDE